MKQYYDNVKQEFNENRISGLAKTIFYEDSFKCKKGGRWFPCSLMFSDDVLSTLQMDLC